MEKPKELVAREEAFLSRIKLCEHNLNGQRSPSGGRVCNFAHWLAQLRVPNEGSGAWWKAWDKGDVDIRCWPEYIPNRASIHRFTRQFNWERHNHPKQIPNWAWGHAAHLGLLDQDQIPFWVPKDYDWPDMQLMWRIKKRAGENTACCYPPRPPSRPPPKAPPPQQPDAG